jgi:hypothetical protein
MDAVLCCRCKSVQVAEAIKVVMAMEEVVGKITNIQLVQPAKANVSVKYTLKMMPIVMMVLKMNEAVETDMALVAGHMGQVAVDY